MYIEQAHILRAQLPTHIRERIIARSRLSLDGSREGVVRHALIISSSFPYLRGTSALLPLSRRETAAWWCRYRSLARARIYDILSKTSRRNLWRETPIVEACQDLTRGRIVFARFSHASRQSIQSISLSLYLSVSRKGWTQRYVIYALRNRRVFRWKNTREMWGFSTRRDAGNSISQIDMYTERKVFSICDYNHMVK